MQWFVVKFIPVHIMWNDRHSRTRVQFHFKRFHFFFQIDQNYITARFAPLCIFIFPKTSSNDVTLHDVIGGHQAYINRKKDRNMAHPILHLAHTTRDEIINSLCSALSSYYARRDYKLSLLGA